MKSLRHIAPLLILFYACPAFAENLMPAGASPESGLAGVWRIISAETVPWAAPRSPGKQGAPLLEYAVEFTAGEIRGPAPLACTTARYSSGVSDQAHIFSGKLATDAGGTLAQKLNLGNGAPTVYRIYCGEKTQDYYVDKESNLVMAADGVLYTLERPTGMDPQQYTAGYSGPSFDCTKAKTTGERLICRDAALSKSDRALAEAYAALRHSVSGDSFATFQAAQRAWSGYVMKTCGAAGTMPETAGDRTPIIDCITTEYDSRAGLLTGLRAEKSGKLLLEPRIHFRRQDEKHLEESDIYPFMSGGPQAAAFNDFISKMPGLSKERIDTSDLLQSDDTAGDRGLHLHRSYNTARFDGRIASLQVTTDDALGGNQNALAQTALTWNLETGRVVTLDDVFAAGKDWKPFVTGLCKNELQKQLDNPDGDAIPDKEIAATVADNAHWLWGDDKAALVFMPGTIGGLAAGEVDVDIPLESLKAYMKPGAPVGSPASSELTRP